MIHTHSPSPHRFGSPALDLGSCMHSAALHCHVNPSSPAPPSRFWTWKIYVKIDVENFVWDDDQKNKVGGNHRCTFSDKPTCRGLLSIYWAWRRNCVSARMDFQRVQLPTANWMWVILAWNTIILYNTIMNIHWSVWHCMCKSAFKVYGSHVHICSAICAAILKIFLSPKLTVFLVSFTMPKANKNIYL